MINCDNLWEIITYVYLDMFFFFKQSVPHFNKSATLIDQILTYNLDMPIIIRLSCTPAIRSVCGLPYIHSTSSHNQHEFTPIIKRDITIRNINTFV